MPRTQPYQILFDALSQSEHPEAVSLLGAVDVLRDQAVTYVCGSKPRQTLPFSAADILEVAVKVSHIDPKPIGRSTVAPIDTMTPGDCPPLPAPVVRIVNGVEVWEPWK